jgi:hypothetical protein
MAVEDGQKPGETPVEGQKPQETGAAGGERKPTDAEAALLKENMAYKKRLQALEKAQTDAEEKRLAAQGEFKTLAEKADARAKAAQDKLKLAILKNTAAAAGLIDPDLIAIADLSGVTIEDDGTVTGAAEAIEAFRAAKPAFFGVPAANGAHRPTTTPKPTGSTGTAGPGTFLEWEQMPAADRMSWADKHPQEFARLCEIQSATPTRRF